VSYAGEEEGLITESRKKPTKGSKEERGSIEGGGRGPKKQENPNREKS